MGDTKCSGRRFFAAACIFGALTALCAPVAFSQTLTTGDIAGLVKEDASDAMVPSAMVTPQVHFQNNWSQSRRLAISVSIGNPGLPY
jgi:hypothetical protein